MVTSPSYDDDRPDKQGFNEKDTGYLWFEN